MRGSLRIGSIAGIVISINYTWILALAIISWSLAAAYFPQNYSTWTASAYWIVGISTAILLFVSVLLHELAHSLVARSRGMPVNSITLFIFGGVANIEKEPEKPKAEFLMSVVGPLTSIALAGVFWGLSITTGPESSHLPALLKILAIANAQLAAFNILPGFPLDGGRVLRSIIWGATGNLDKATNIAATIGRTFGWLLIAFGVYWSLDGKLLGGSNFLGGLWIAFIGWFLSSAAEASRREVTLREHLNGITVKEAMEPNPEVVSPTASVASVVHDIFLQHGRRAVPVCSGDRIVGIATLTDVKGVPQDQWTSTPVENIMTKEPIYYVKENDDLNAALKLLADHGLNQVVVLREGKLAGMISRADIIRYLQVQQELGVVPKQTNRTTAPV